MVASAVVGDVELAPTAGLDGVDLAVISGSVVDARIGYPLT